MCGCSFFIAQNLHATYPLVSSPEGLFYCKIIGEREVTVMELYILRMTRLGFSLSRAYAVYADFRKNNALDELDKYITALEYSWSD